MMVTVVERSGSLNVSGRRLEDLTIFSLPEEVITYTCLHLNSDFPMTICNQSFIMVRMRARNGRDFVYYMERRVDYKRGNAFSILLQIWVIAGLRLHELGLRLCHGFGVPYELQDGRSC